MTVSTRSTMKSRMPLALVGVVGLAATGAAFGQAGGAGASGTPAAVAAAGTPALGATAPSIQSERSTLLKLSRRMSLKVDKARLEDVMKFIQEVTQAEIEVLWTSENTQGLERDREITLSVANQPALYVLEQVLDKAKSDFRENSWQMAAGGALQVGPKDLLNQYKRVEIYDINDLLFVIPTFSDVPQIDLNNVLQQASSGGGGGGQSPFTGAGNNNSPLNDQPTKDQRARPIIELLTQTIETNQWVDNGGEGGSIRFYNGTLIINAPDYMHRQIVGYPYWPSTTVRRLAGGGRYVTLSMDAGVARPLKITNFPVTATAGGGTTTGGGGQPAPTTPGRP